MDGCMQKGFWTFEQEQFKTEQKTGKKYLE